MPATEAQDLPYFGAIVELDKVVYNWTDGVWISVVAPDANSDPFDIDYIGCGANIHLIGDKNECSHSLVTITSTHIINNVTMFKEKLDWYMLEETGVDTGVFIGHVLLTGFSHDVDGDGRDDPIMNIQSRNNVNQDITGDTSGGGPWDGRIKANPGNTITVKFSEKYSGTTNFHEANATVEFWVAELGLQSDVITSNQPVTVTVVDPDMNLGFFNRDQLYVDVYSDSDAGGFQLLLTETEILDDDGTSFIIQNSGIFEGQFSSVSVGGTAGSLAEIFAKPGDTITVEYNECTLPQPFSLGDCIVIAGTAVVGTPEPTSTKSVTAIPSWIKNNAEWWADGVIDDSSFLQGIEYLINEGIIVIPPTTTSGASGSQEDPARVKKNASWWVDGTIDDSTFVSGIQYLVKAGIIQVG